ncbi:aspartate/tyrosine/aromatic aminotransferase [Rubidibacter lacunae KORDI 51-2]|uniref:Aminotransferase n=1 Tax=Rubidibacter lacunae KORDI 51-2 TaxID=582515 RepID=U5DK89_9CHRO|nr:LL-diaminopimelate aminotransferase [Rubidibacter lacunae]ERN40095.1 aspartate/tyrosine/aromatic aminotransferase [Rubidibacter lacunae KORDI 51-2]
MHLARRMQALQSNVFADMDRAKARAIASGQAIVDLSLGSSDLPASDWVLDEIARSLHDPQTHGYALFHSTQAFRESVARWYQDRYGLPVDPETEVLPLIGCQEGTAHLPLALLDPGDVALLQDPGYPSHAGGVHLAGGEVSLMPARVECGFLPVLDDIPPAIRDRARMMVLSYPHNPTTAMAPRSFFEEAVAFCRRHAIALVHDFPYAEVVFAGRAPSVFEADRNKDIAIEFYSFSKSYNMGGFRIAFAIGNRALILALRQVKSVIDFNQYRGIANGAIAALEGPQEGIRQTVAAFRARRDAFVAALHRHGWDVPLPPATMYVWAQLPDTWSGTSLGFCTQLVETTGVALAPGSGFGQAGEGYVRVALVRDIPTLEMAATRITDFARSQ